MGPELQNLKAGCSHHTEKMLSNDIKATVRYVLELPDNCKGH